MLHHSGLLLLQALQLLVKVRNAAVLLAGLKAHGRFGLGPVHGPLLQLGQAPLGLVLGLQGCPGL